MNHASLDAALASSLDAIPDGPARDAGAALGAAVGRTIVDLRADDGMDIPDPFTPTPGPGVWEPTPPTFSPMLEPQFQNVRPFLIQARDQFSLSPQPALTSRTYTADFSEVFEFGRDTSTVRTADQTHSALFWREPSPAGWSRMANIVSVDNDYDLHQTARLLALVNMAMADGFIAGIYYKRVHAGWRPVTAIQRADTDGNRHTTADPTWLPLRPTAAVPDHPSTHSVLGAAAAEVLRRFTRKNHHRLCMTSQTAEPAGSTRCWRTFAEAALENADSRVSLGFHFRFATTAGVRLGAKIGRYGFRNNLRPLRGHHDDDDDADEDDPDEN
jgi:PAP2 superfamily